jgi:hypothetical protein
VPIPTTDAVHRRDILRVGSLAVSASILPGLSSAADNDSSSRAPARSVIYLWMGGGVTHIDSFDPKPKAPEEIRGTLTDIATNVPGIRFCETLPRLAQVADQLCVVRSFSHDSDDHLLSQVYTLSGRKVTQNQLFSEPNIGAIISRVRGPSNGLPGYIAVPGVTRPGPPPHNLFVGGWLGEEHAPFAVGGEPDEPDFTKNPRNWGKPPGEAEEDLSPKTLRLPDHLKADRLLARARLRQALDQGLLQAERQGVLKAADGQHDGALNLLTSPIVRKAFDLTQETDATRKLYGRTKLGGRCLLARRLVEAGARFVMVDYGYDPDYGNLWDNHCVPVQKQPPICQIVKHGYHLAGMDHAFAGLIADLRQRGLLDSTLVVFLTEFGRTPKINKDGGRDHWGACGSIFFAGAGVNAGQVIGATDKHAAYPTTNGHTPADLAATIYQAIGLDPQARIHDRHNRPHFVLPDGTAISGVMRA